MLLAVITHKPSIVPMPTPCKMNKQKTPKKLRDNLPIPH